MQRANVLTVTAPPRAFQRAPTTGPHALQLFLGKLTPERPHTAPGRRLRFTDGLWLAVWHPPGGRHTKRALCMLARCTPGNAGGIVLNKSNLKLSGVSGAATLPDFLLISIFMFLGLTLMVNFLERVLEAHLRRSRRASPAQGSHARGSGA